MQSNENTEEPSPCVSGMQKNGGLLFNLRREIAPKKLLKFTKDFTVFKDLVEGYYESEMLCFLGR